MAVDSKNDSSSRSIELQVVVHVSGSENRYHGTSVDLSSSGIFVRMREEIAQGKRVDIVISSEKLGVNIATTATVVHRLPSTGLGLRFGVQTDRLREEIKELVDALRDSAADTVVSPMKGFS